MRARLAAALEYLGPAGVAGIGVLVFCAAFELSWLAPLAAKQRQLESRLVAARSGLAAKPQASRRDPAAELAAFLAELPKSSALRAATAEIHERAGRAGVSLKSGNYRLVWEKNGRIGRWQMSFDTEAAYPATRRFLGELLLVMPALALENVAFQRREIGGGKPETTLRLSLLVARESGAESAREAP